MEAHHHYFKGRKVNKKTTGEFGSKIVAMRKTLGSKSPEFGTAQKCEGIAYLTARLFLFSVRESRKFAELNLIHRSIRSFIKRNQTLSVRKLEAT